MMKISVDFYSDILKRRVDFNVILPEDKIPKRIILLLHGRSDDNSAWLDYTNVAVYNKEKRNLIIMPTGQTSFYLNEHNGENFCDHLIEILEFVTDIFNIETKEVICAGNSMGGFGSLNMIANHSNIINKVALFSPAIMINDYRMMYNDFYDYKTNLHKKISNIDVSRIYHYCGTSDHLYFQNVNFSKEFGTTLHTDKYAHVWETWDLQIKKYLNELPD